MNIFLKVFIIGIRAEKKKLRTRHHRTLSIPEYLNDRWEKAKELGFGDGSSIYDSALVFGDVSVGKNTWIGPNVILDGSGGLSIGDDCDISAGVQIYTHDTVERHSKKGFTGSTLESVVIKSNTYIGPNTVISKGVEIGHNVIIGANSFVHKSIPDNVKVFGNPCVIREHAD
jgi:acetyltransferase-like isoleucine patch superfamily enzyme